MNRIYSTCFLLLIVSNVCNAQFVLRGVVRNSIGFYIPSANVVVINNPKLYKTVADANGAFSMKYPQSTTKVRVSSISYITQTVTLDATQENIITLIPEVEPVFPDSTPRHVQLRFDIGYYGDVNHAPKGVLAVMPFRGIGYRKAWTVYTAFKYWEGASNDGMDVSISKPLLRNKGARPNHIFFSYHSYNYRNEGFHWTQYRALLSEYLAGVSFDIGAAYNKINTGQEAPVNDAWRLSGSIGIVYSVNLGGDGGFGLRTNFNYTPDYPFFEAGAFKQFPIRPFATVTMLVKYYRYQEMTGMMFGLTANILTTKSKQQSYSCCYSRPMPLDYIHVLK